MKNSFKHNTANLLCAAALAVLGSVPLTAQACAGEPLIGSVCTVAFNWCPQGYLQANGQEVSINNYQALYALIGTIYGGNATSTFKLPDLRGRVIAGSNVTGGVPNISPLPLGTMDGAESVKLLPNNLPQHTHPTTGSTATASGTVTLPLDSANTSITGQTIGGTLTVNAITTATSGASGTPSSSNNMVGKVGSGSPAYYTYDATKALAAPVTNNLTVSGGTVSGNAKGDVSLPITDVAVAVGNNVTTNTPVPTISPRIALTACIAYQGLYPMRP